MELESLRTFVMAVRLGSLTAAARELGRTQPAITVQIQGLEREVGDRLLVRRPRGVRPTAAGEILYSRGQAMLREARELLDELRDIGSLRSGELHIGATDVMAIGHLPKILARFKRRYPGIRVAVEVEGSRGLAARVRSGDLDLAIVTLPADHPDLETREIHREPVYLVGAPGHHLARRRVDLGEIAQEALIHHKRDSVTRREVEAVFRAHGLEPRVAMEVNSPEAIKELVALGLGIAPLSRSQVSKERQTGKLVRLTVPAFSCWRRSGLIRRRGVPPLRVVAALMDMLPARA
ncbi:MAG: LysR family transcriptional regulator [Candidatus Eisenbacteria sp.]|nr:LysR family transcriptional regulator [Candidatus Eisenbacteria bacterium]